MPRIFASGVFGSDYDLWGAWSFSDRKTRDKLAQTIADDDWCLAIGMTSPHTPQHERGRLLALLQIGHEAVDTRELVEPEHWRRTVEEHGNGKWLHAFPIRRVQRFIPGPGGLPLRREVLPRIDSENRYMQVGRYYLELDEEEAAVVFRLARTEETAIFRSSASMFAAALRKTRAGPPPSPGTRVLSTLSGPAATYLMRLEGDAEPQVTAVVRPSAEHAVWKIGFSNDPARRLEELNAYLPCHTALRWKLCRQQWHSDEINAYSLEQRIFNLVEAHGIHRFKGEMICARAADVDTCWTEGLRSASRPSHEIIVRAYD
ncbi:hypothetical protein KCP91_16265 [Microvirga sp. SRT01]|uniref:GIY-YIG nuclease family protein n=1 Tax=Sphingomonas longa TaxID=2778730 RepID=A0ABS2DAI0_9SPHN|nr:MULTISPECIES: hypothetical protein [Alphaproteobacteria]MBM6577940.1 hypothetical protein [Sphingomonas sp. BT552]MBR7710981.1 hypothetical protein [Microvirga sp. SRT01]